LSTMHALEKWKGLFNMYVQGKGGRDKVCRTTNRTKFVKELH